MFPPGEKRGTFMYNDTPIQISGSGQYGDHPDYNYLEGRKLEDVYPSGGFSTWSGRFVDGEKEIFLARQENMPAWKLADLNRSKGK